MDFLSSLQVGNLVGIKDKSPYPNQPIYSIATIDGETQYYWIVNGLTFVKSNGLSYPLSKDLLLCPVEEAEQRMKQKT